MEDADAADEAVRDGHGRASRRRGSSPSAEEPALRTELEDWHARAGRGRGGARRDLGPGAARGARRRTQRIRVSAAGRAGRRQPVHRVPRHGHLVGHADPAQGRRARPLRELRPHPGAAPEDPAPAHRWRLARQPRTGRHRGRDRGRRGHAAADVASLLGVRTNNEAEYQALIDGLKAVAPWKPDRLEIYLDSKLVVEQVNGTYRVKKPELQPLHTRGQGPAGRLSRRSRSSTSSGRSNKGADKLANMALDEQVKKAAASRVESPRAEADG